jgi:hypothetical protein
MSLIDDIRGYFPNPVKMTEAATYRDGAYCVGGAFIAWHEGNTEPLGADSETALRFPAYWNLEAELEGDYLTDHTWEVAVAITDANDREDFTLAWEILEAALEGRVHPSVEIDVD